MDKQQRLDLIAGKIATCKKCKELCGRTNTVPGEGNPDALVMFIGEGPGQHEDEQGRPFVGAAGKLLDNMIAACGWKREEVFIANILKCRTPGNRKPLLEEMNNCRPFLDLQIKTVQPKIIVLLGATALQGLLDIWEPISVMRGKWLEYNGIKTMPTFHPSYLLHIQEEKKEHEAKGQVWSDLKKVMKELYVSPTTK